MSNLTKEVAGCWLIPCSLEDFCFDVSFFFSIRLFDAIFSRKVTPATALENLENRVTCRSINFFKTKFHVKKLISGFARKQIFCYQTRKVTPVNPYVTKTRKTFPTPLDDLPEVIPEKCKWWKTRSALYNITIRIRLSSFNYRSRGTV